MLIITELGHVLCCMSCRVVNVITKAAAADAGQVELGASIYDVSKIFGLFDPPAPLSANSRSLPY